MFHHFKGGNHIEGQGAITQEQFQQIIEFLKKNYNLIGAAEFNDKCEKNKLASGDVVLSFDDGLKCQYDLALDVLDFYKIDAYFFIYTGIFEKVGTELEIYRDFRSRKFDGFDNFFALFLEKVATIFHTEKLNHLKAQAAKFLNEHQVYTKNDRIYRYLRDVVLSSSQYKQIMESMMADAGYFAHKYFENLFMNKKEVLDLANRSHCIGLHSHSHPTMIQDLDILEQKQEYIQNLKILNSILNIQLKAMSHPCGRYNTQTLQVLRKLGVKTGFRSSMSKIRNQSTLEIPRNDHMNVLRAATL